MNLFSTPQQLAKLRRTLLMALRLPFLQGQRSVPGSVLEEALASVRSGTVLHTYDFVDVISPDDACGWQVKSTRAATPVTWKRAKLPDAPALIEASKRSATACQELGDAIINLCNEHAQQSLMAYDLEELGYARLIVHDRSRVTYFEKFLCSASRPRIFNPRDFSWRWSERKASAKKELLPALHGIHKRTNQRWWAWHGLGENQLHFTGETAWWSTSQNRSFSFRMPAADERLTIDSLLMILERHPSDS